MAAPHETPVRAPVAVPSPPRPSKGPPIPEKADTLDHDDRMSRQASLIARFLDNLRLALSMPHA
jgi:hypothetical protein